MAGDDPLSRVESGMAPPSARAGSEEEAADQQPGRRGCRDGVRPQQLGSARDRRSIGQCRAGPRRTVRPFPWGLPRLEGRAAQERLGRAGRRGRRWRFRTGRAALLRACRARRRRPGTASAPAGLARRADGGRRCLPYAREKPHRQREGQACTCQNRLVGPHGPMVMEERCQSIPSIDDQRPEQTVRRGRARALLSSDGCALDLRRAPRSSAISISLPLARCMNASSSR